jgi:hypothetical protein
VPNKQRQGCATLGRVRTQSCLHVSWKVLMTFQVHKQAVSDISCACGTAVAIKNPKESMNFAICNSLELQHGNLNTGSDA